MVYQAPIVAGIIGLAMLYRSVSMKLEKGGKKLPMFLQYYTILYVLVFVLTVMAICSLYTDVLAVTEWMDDDAVKAFVMNVMNNSPGDTPCLPCTEPCTPCTAFGNWTVDADIGDKPWLKWFAIICPLFALGCFGVCAFHTWQHVQQMKENNGGKIMHMSGNALWNDSIVVIVVLPAIYGLMSFKSVVRMLQVYVNHVPVAGGDDSALRFQSYNERKSFLVDMYTANFAVGDIMETVALIIFGQLISQYLNKRIEVTLHNMESKSLSDKDIESVEAANKTVANLTVAGVQLFCLACILSGAWDLTITTMPTYFPSVLPHLFSTAEPVGLLQLEATKAHVESVLLGFSFAASFAAIGNIMTLEEQYHHFLDAFSPKMKFWGTKMLVSLAALQGSTFALLTGVGWSTIEVDLLYACVLTLECFLIALFHMLAWPAQETWHKDQLHDRDSESRLSSFGEEAVKPLLA